MNVDLNAVIGELKQRRRKSPDMKVATMTVVAFFDEEVVGGWVCDRIHMLAVKHPSRVIILDGTKDDDQHTFGSSCPEHDECVKTGDWVELGVRGINPNLLPSAIAALVLPEAPRVLIWVATGVKTDPRFEALAPIVGTIVFNTSVLTYDDAALGELAAFARERGTATITDLAYLRLYPWQEAIAQFFDHSATFHDLFSVNRVEITCGSDPEALYLFGWLASRLGWKAAGRNLYRSATGEPIEIAIVRKGLPRRILKIELSSASTRFVAEIDDERAEAIMLSVTGEKTHPGRARPINNIDLAALVERAILTGHTDTVFQESLLAAGELIEKRRDS
ncbi:MAG TPA: glucose-6-phosphate dehydrogenase assembly protein OpcA [Candidatus Acidoferrales bacterium]|nr:glucose-6-phosphate dehydrogenase assembly protein OpcA [Candidatus Acidoferrales bacterium]